MKNEGENCIVKKLGKSESGIKRDKEEGIEKRDEKDKKKEEKRNSTKRLSKKRKEKRRKE